MGSDLPILKVADGTVSLISTGGQLIRVPTAREIFAAAVRRDPSAFSPPLASPPSETCSEVSFDSLPADLRIVVESRGVDLKSSLEAITEDGGVHLVTRGTVGPDHALIQNRWIPFRPGSLDEIRENLGGANLHIPSKISLADLGRLLRAVSPDTKLEIRIDQSKLLAARRVIPPGFVGNLYPYQLDGYAWLTLCLESGVGCILADEMGLGKTVQIIAAITAGMAKNLRPQLVVAPTTILENWRREIAKFSPSLRVTIHSGQFRTGDPARLSAADIVVTSWGIAVRDLSLLRGVEWAAVFLDEAQLAKNPDTLRTQSISKIPARARFPVTGTPVENRLRDLCTLLSIALPGEFADPLQLEATWASEPGRFGEMAAPFLLRRTVATVAPQLPPLVHIPEILVMSQTEAAFYEAAKKRGPSPLALLTDLRRLCAHPFLHSGDTGDPVAASQKYTRLCELLGELREDGQKAIVSSEWHALTDLMLRDLADRFRLPVGVIDGRVHQSRRQEVVDRFESAEGAAVLIVSPRAGGLGLNITAARHVIHYVPDWNPAVVDQLTARAHRLGQTETVFETRLYYQGTVEEAIEILLERKRAVATAAVLESTEKEEDVKEILGIAGTLSPAV